MIIDEPEWQPHVAADDQSRDHLAREYQRS